MAVPTLITDLSTTIATNSPSGSDAVFPDLDNYIRALSAFIAQNYANKLTVGASGNVVIAAPSSGTALTLSGLTGGSASANALSIQNNRLVTFLDSAGVTTNAAWLWYDAVNALNIGVNAANRVVIPATGEVLISRATSTSSVAKLQVGDGTGPMRAIINTDDQYAISVRAGATAADYWIGASGGASPDLRFSNNGATMRLTLTDDGRLFGSALHNNAGAMTGATNQYVGSGTYTPTLTSTTNVAASTSRACQWIRVGNVVTVSGLIDVDPTSGGATLTTLGISLPIASNFAVTDLAGTAVDASNGDSFGSIVADVTNDRATLNFRANNASNVSWTIHFTYLIAP